MYGCEGWGWGGGRVCEVRGVRDVRMLVWVSKNRIKTVIITLVPFVC